MGRSKDLATGTFTTALDVQGAITSDGLTVDTSDQVIINHSGDAGGLRIDSTNNTNTGSIRFGDVADNYIGAVEYNHTSDALSFYANNATRMTINSSGHVTKPNQPHFFANRGGLNNEQRNGNVNYNVIRDTESAWNSTNHQYTIPTTGVYHFGFNNISHTGISTSHTDIRLQYVRSGTTYSIAYAYQTNDSLHEQTNLSITHYLQANDLVQLYNYGGVVYAGDYNTFSICLVG